MKKALQALIFLINPFKGPCRQPSYLDVLKICLVFHCFIYFLLSFLRIACPGGGSGMKTLKIRLKTMEFKKDLENPKEIQPKMKRSIDPKENTNLQLIIGSNSLVLYTCAQKSYSKKNEIP